MATVISSGTSPASRFSIPLDEDEESQSWRFLESLGADTGSFDSGSGEIVFTAASPSIVSQGSWNVVHNNGAQHQQMRALTTPSPVMSQNAQTLSTSPFSGAAAFGPVSAANLDAGSNSSLVFDFSDLPLDTTQQQVPQQQFVVSEALLNEQATALAPQNFVFTPQDMMVSGFHTGFDAVSMITNDTFSALDQQQPQFTQQLDIPVSMQGTANVQPWDPTALPQTKTFVSEQFTTPPPPPRSDGSSISLSPRSPASPPVKQEPRSGGSGISTASSKRNSTQVVQTIPKKPAGIQKTQKKKASTSPRSSSSSSSSDSSDSRIKDGMLMFCNQTVETWGKPNFADLENIERSSQKGRKGALSEEVRANALKVRQTGACFCCHIRKVKCDQQRPCKNCVKLCAQVPEAVCWKFPDFTEILFPELMRSHLRRDETTRFIEENVASFTMDGVETPCRVTLSSGASIGARLVLVAKFFTARHPNSDINRHWYHFVDKENHSVELEALRTAPIGLDIADGAAGGSQRSELRRKVEAYVEAMVADPGYGQQVTDSMHKSFVPRRVLAIVQQYAAQSGAPIVRRALAIYGMHYIMTRHLTMTPQCIASLRQVNPVSATGGYLTPRLLNRQIKTVIDDLMQQEVNALFDDLTKRLKGKSRVQWAPCLAAFLVFCLLMEAIEAATDAFTVAGDEIEIRNKRPVLFGRRHALQINDSIENMPFKQFAFQFHNIYQTHSRDASAKSFNPLFGEGLNDLGDLDPGALEMVLDLRNLMECYWNEMDWLTFDPILPSEGHTYPMDSEEQYVGRLVSKFLLSFERPSYIFASA